MYSLYLIMSANSSEVGAFTKTTPDAPRYMPTKTYAIDSARQDFFVQRADIIILSEY